MHLHRRPPIRSYLPREPARLVALIQSHRHLQPHQSRRLARFRNRQGRQRHRAKGDQGRHSLHVRWFHGI
jgi:hypothetical protein